MIHIIAHSLTHKAGNGTLRHRIVLRCMHKTGKYAIHTQVFSEVLSDSFSQGDYFTDILEAATRFTERKDRLESIYKEFLEP